MALLSIAEAAKAVGRNRATLHRYINEGKVSATVDDLGKRVVDTSELLRVFGEFRKSDSATVARRRNEMSGDSELYRATEYIKWLTAQLEEEKARSRRLEEEKEREREHSRELERLMLAAGTAEKKPGLFARLLGKM